MKRPSNRIVVDEQGKSTRMEVDDTPGADNSAAHGYDHDAGRKYNERFRAPGPKAKAKPEEEQTS